MVLAEHAQKGKNTHARPLGAFFVAVASSPYLFFQALELGLGWRWGLETSQDIKRVDANVTGPHTDCVYVVLTQYIYIMHI